VSSLVLDASAVLAVILAETGADAVIPRLPGAFLSCVNLAEVVARALDLGKPLEETVREIGRLPLHVAAYGAEQAYYTASLRPATRPLGLSLGDRACLALAMSRKATVLTGDRDWRKLDVGIDIVVFR
jgi:PIN domain nuclease of toxin-antitoxin system